MIMNVEGRTRAAACKEIDLVYAGRERSERWYAWWSVCGTLTGTMAAGLIAVFEGGVEPFFVFLSLFFLVITGFGVSAGLHRYFSHYSYAAKRPFQVALAVLGIASAQGYFIRWVFDHRIHHRYTDMPGDPHSPYFRGETELSRIGGLLHAHFGWLLRGRSVLAGRVVGDLASDPVMTALDRQSPAIALVGVLVAALIGWSFEPSAMGFLKGALWGGPVRMFLLNHIVWSVNSIGHSVGSKVEGVRSQARNNALLGFLAFGDGWHANHHLSPLSARHGWQKGALDLSWTVLRLLERIGWVYNLRDACERGEKRQQPDS